MPALLFLFGSSILHFLKCACLRNQTALVGVILLFHHLGSSSGVFFSHAGDQSFIHDCNRPNSLNQVLILTLPNAR